MIISLKWLPRLSPPLCLKEFSLERTRGELRPLSLRCGDEGSLSLETSGSGSLSVMHGVILCCLFRTSGEVTPWAKRGCHWNVQISSRKQLSIPKIKDGKAFNLALMRDYSIYHWYRIWRRPCLMTHYITFIENNPGSKIVKTPPENASMSILFKCICFIYTLNIMISA